MAHSFPQTELHRQYFNILTVHYKSLTQNYPCSSAGNYLQQLARFRESWYYFPSARYFKRMAVHRHKCCLSKINTMWPTKQKSEDIQVEHPSPVTQWLNWWETVLEGDFQWPCQQTKMFQIFQGTLLLRRGHNKRVITQVRLWQKIESTESVLEKCYLSHWHIRPPIVSVH